MTFSRIFDGFGKASKPTLQDNSQKLRSGKSTDGVRDQFHKREDAKLELEEKGTDEAPEGNMTPRMT